MILTRTRYLLTAGAAVCLGGTCSSDWVAYLYWRVRVNLRLSLSATSSATSSTSPWTGSIRRIPVVSETLWSAT